MFERPFFLEHRGIAFERERGIEDAGAAAGRLLGLAVCGALSVPRKNLVDPDVAALRTARRCTSRLATGRQ